jgi:hypothetical protein
MRVAIHHRPGSYSDRWIARLSSQNAPHTVVDGFANDIVHQVAGHDLFLWHWSLADPRELRHAQAVLNAVASTGCAVYPNAATAWHYDDKVAQKYLLEAVGAPLARTHVFYSEDAAVAWLASASFPVVFKLARGAGSANVRLVKDFESGRRLVHAMFTRGTTPTPGFFYDVRRKLERSGGIAGLRAKIGRAPATLRAVRDRRSHAHREKGYAYFQEFLPGNDHDTRVFVIGGRAIAFQRRNRPGDFRASGSGDFLFDHRAIPTAMVDIAFATSARLGFQTMAYDFLVDRAGRPLICEISYCVVAAVYTRCEGFWDADLEFHPQSIRVEDLILDALYPQMAREGGPGNSR